MMRKIIKMLNNKKGFTLIELIVVIAVLGILAAVALPRIGNVVSKADTSADAQQVRILNEALERYIAESGDSDLEGTYGTGSADIDTSVDSIIAALRSGISFGTDSYGPYLKASVTKELPSGANVLFSDQLFSAPESED